MAKKRSAAANDEGHATGGHLGFAANRWQSAGKLRNNANAAEPKPAVLANAVKGCAA